MPCQTAPSETLFDCGRSAWIIYSLKHDCFIDVQNDSAGVGGFTIALVLGIDSWLVKPAPRVNFSSADRFRPSPKFEESNLLASQPLGELLDKSAALAGLVLPQFLCLPAKVLEL